MLFAQMDNSIVTVSVFDFFFFFTSGGGGLKPQQLPTVTNNGGYQSTVIDK